MAESKKISNIVLENYPPKISLDRKYNKRQILPQNNEVGWLCPFLHPTFPSLTFLRRS